MADAIDDLLAEIERRGGTVAYLPAERVERSGPSERLRTAAQGLTFATADEAEAALRSVFSEREYGDILKEIRTAVSEYRQDKPGEAISYEIGGALLPVAGSLIMTALSGGGATPAAVASAARTGTLAKTLLGGLKATGTGAAMGGAYSFAAGEGGEGPLFDQVLNRAQNVPTGAVAGAIGGAGGYAALTGIGAGARGFLGWVNRKFGDRVSKSVEAEFKRVAEDAGMTVDDLVNGIKEGRFPAEMGGNKTMATVARAYRDQSRAAGTILEDAYAGRTRGLRQDMLTMLREELAQTKDPNVIKAITTKIDDLLSQESDSYNQVFASSPGVTEDIVSGLEDALKRSPEAGKEAQKIYRAETGKAPFWSIGEDGSVTFARPPTLQDAEIIRRGLKDVTNSAYTSGSGNLGSALNSVERDVRGQLDDFSPALKATRENWSNLKSAREAFDAGRRALNKQPDEVALELEGITSKEAKAAYKAGVASAYRARGFTGAGASLPRKLTDDTTKEGAILRMVFPQGQLKKFLDVADKAARSSEAEGVILGNSITNTAAGRVAQNNAGRVVDAVERVASQGPVSALLQTAAGIIKSARPALSDMDTQRLAKLMVETDPQAFQAAMGGGPNAIAKYMDNFMIRANAAGGSAGARTGAVAFAPRSALAGLLSQQGQQ